VAVGFREASDCAVDAGARRQRGRGGTSARCERNQWRHAFERGELFEPCALLSVSVATPGELASETPDRSAEEQTTSGGTIHIELPGGAMIWVESGSDPALLRSILESLRQ